MKKILLSILILISLTGCWSIQESSQYVIRDSTFMFKWEAEVYANHLRKEGKDAEVCENNWFNNGGYPWKVYIKEKKELKNDKEKKD